jgi:hypothetical protein
MENFCKRKKKWQNRPCQRLIFCSAAGGAQNKNWPTDNLMFSFKEKETSFLLLKKSSFFIKKDSVFIFSESKTYSTKLNWINQNKSTL